MMHTDLIKATIEQCANQPLFEVCYVRGIQATYALYDQSEDFGQPIFYKTIDMMKRAVVDMGYAAQFYGENAPHALRNVLDQAYDVDRILEDAIGQSHELLFDVKRGMPILDHMHEHIVFGQSVYYGDVQELTWKLGEHTYTMGTRIGRERKEGWMIIDGDGKRTEIVIPLTK